MTVLKIGNATRKGNTGSVAAIVCYADQPDAPLLLSASHVLVPGGSAPGDVIVDADSQQAIGTLLTWTGVLFAVGYPNIADAALVTLTPGLDLSTMFGHVIRRPFARQAPVPDDMLTLAGTATTTQVRDTNRDCLIPWQSCELGYTALIVADPVTAPGDSGAALLDTAGALAGLVVGITDPESDFGLQCTAATSIAAIAGFAGWGHRLQPYGIAPPPVAAGVPLPADDTLQTLTLTLWGEARGEPAWNCDPDAGMKAVACVVLNRVKAGRNTWGRSISEVCKKPSQFSCWNADDPNLAKFPTAPDNPAYPRAEAVATDAIAGRLADITDGATFYYDPDGMPKDRHGVRIPPQWAVGHTPCATIGNQIFFNDVH